MKTITNTPKLLPRALAALAMLALCAVTSFAQATSGGTQIQNRASATYSDGTNSYSVNSNIVTVTVANVTGLTISPDGRRRTDERGLHVHRHQLGQLPDAGALPCARRGDNHLRPRHRHAGRR